MDNEESINRIKEFNVLQSKISASATIKDCFHHNKSQCKLPIKSAHSLQKQGALKQLERNIYGNMKLYCHSERVINIKENFLDLKPIGRKEASTFFGFCDYHDTKLFSVIENDPEVTDIDSNEHCFLHSYRSFAHSYHRKYEEYKLFSSNDNEIVEILIKRYGVSGIKENLYYIGLALKDLEKPKSLLDSYIDNCDYGELDYLVFEFPYKIPIGCAASITPSHTYSGKEINTSSDPNFEYSNIITTVIPFSNRSIVILAAFKNEPNGVMFLDEIDNIKYEVEKQKFLSYILMNNAENCFLSPDFYNKMNFLNKKRYCSLLDFIGQRDTPYLSYLQSNIFFPVNYFSSTNALK